MIVILKQNTKKEDLDRFISMLNSYHVKIADISGEQHSIFGLIGDTSKIDIDLLRAQPVVADVKRVQEPYKSCNRKFHPEDTIVDIAGKKIGVQTGTTGDTQCASKIEGAEVSRSLLRGK